MTAKYSHLTVSDGISYKIKTLCGRYISQYNLGAIYMGESVSFSWPVAPLCPKCAALKLIAETGVSK
jgi:hypothetical protein